jgi:hypothetical protein
MWIDPANPDHMLVGSDGGIHLSYDRGRTWDFVNTVPLAQFYEVAADHQRPYHVYGGLQDNGSWSAPSRTLYRQGIANDEWVRVGGGDGFYTVPDWSDPDVVYVESQDGNVARLHRASGQRRVIRPEPPTGEKYRFNWNSPILVSVHDPKTIYYGGNRVFGSRDRGESWTLVSPDLTTSDDVKRDATPIFGRSAKELLSRNDGVVHFGTITTLAESPVKAGVLWAGTDDGNLHVSKDGGSSWTSLAGRVAGVPKGTYVSRVEASRAGEGAAYVAFDGHRGNDFTAYLLFTADYGQTWRSVASNLPAGGTLSVVREHPKNPDVLFVGTERGLWISWDRGGAWMPLRGRNFPTVPVDDLLIHPRELDLVLGTHGRGVWILDDAQPLASLREARGKELHFFPVPAATEWRLYDHKGNTGHKYFLAPNPPEGALLTYWLDKAPGEKDEVRITVSDSSGVVVRELQGPRPRLGLNRASWDLRLEPPVKPEEGAERGFGGPPRGPFVLPGSYTVKIAVAGKEAEQSVVVEDDPRQKLGDAERRAWHEAQLAAGKVWAKADAADKAVKAIRKQLDELKASLDKKKDAPPQVAKAVQELIDKAAPLARRLSLDNPPGFAGAPLAADPEPLLPRARFLGFGLGAYAGAPTADQKRLIERTTSGVDEVAAAIRALQQTDVPALNKLIYESGIGRIDAGAVIP